jgi:hypothetical protein
MLSIPEDNSNDGMLSTVSIKTLVENWFKPTTIELDCIKCKGEWFTETSQEHIDWVSKDDCALYRFFLLYIFKLN